MTILLDQLPETCGFRPVGNGAPRTPLTHVKSREASVSSNVTAVIRMVGAMQFGIDWRQQSAPISRKYFIAVFMREWTDDWSTHQHALSRTVCVYTYSWICSPTHTSVRCTNSDTYVLQQLWANSSPFFLRLGCIESQTVCLHHSLYLFVEVDRRSLAVFFSRQEIPYGWLTFCCFFFYFYVFEIGQQMVGCNKAVFEYTDPGTMIVRIYNMGIYVVPRPFLMGDFFF